MTQGKIQQVLVFPKMLGIAVQPWIYIVCSVSTGGGIKVIAHHNGYVPVAANWIQLKRWTLVEPFDLCAVKHLHNHRDLIHYCIFPTWTTFWNNYYKVFSK
jgi:hypothetical protein